MTGAQYFAEDATGQVKNELEMMKENRNWKGR
jgi:hypothetical protein